MCDKIRLGKGWYVKKYLIPDPKYINERRVGNTTRLIDETIQILFTYNKVIIPTNNLSEDRHFLSKLFNRLLIEHRLQLTFKGKPTNNLAYLKIESNNRILKIIKV